MGLPVVGRGAIPALGFSRGLLSAQARIHLPDCYLLLVVLGVRVWGWWDLFLSHNQYTPACWNTHSARCPTAFCEQEIG